MNAPRRAPRRAVHGVLVLDKPIGLSSTAALAKAKWLLNAEKAGHAGTLDPLATGVLVLLLGEATKLSDVATQEDKTYLAEVCFGRGTDSHDSQGQTTSECELTPGWLDAARLERALDAERSRQQQQPPAVSAIKVAGQRSYRLARAGAAPELALRGVQVRPLALPGIGERLAELELCVTKGYYVRSLARDLGEHLGVPAHLTRLRRIRSGGFDVSEACAWPPPAAPRIIPLGEALPRLVPIWRLTESGVMRARQGKALSTGDFLDPPRLEEGVPDEVVAWTDAAGTPVALGRRDGEVFRVRRGFTAGPVASDTVDR